MDSTRDIQVVSFQWPVPANYGGVIDVYHKVRALRECGADVTLHSFRYRDRANPDLSLSPADRTLLYRRDMGVTRMLSPKPYIVSSRLDKTLLDNLAALPQGSAVIFEGLHMCGFLAHDALKDKIKVVRAHNVEHDYYAALAEKASGMKRLYLALEARKLRAFEPVLRHADLILAISPADREYFTRTYPGVRTIYSPCFFDDTADGSPMPFGAGEPSERYLLYHGNLGVEENIQAVTYIIREIMPLLPPGTPLRIAGGNAPEALRRLIEATPGVSLCDAPSHEEMRSLIGNAAVTLLITDQPTGIKLKLLDTLATARGNILANDAMAGDYSLRPLMMMADTPREQADAIKRGLTEFPSLNELQDRRRTLEANFNSRGNAARVIETIDCVRRSRRL